MSAPIDIAESGEPSSPPSSCSSCGASLPTGARLCRECGSYQATCLNWLMIGSRIVAVASAFLAALVFGLTNCASIRSALWYRDDLRVLQLESTASVTLGNHGDGSVFVSHVSTSIDLGLGPDMKLTQTVPVDATVNRGDVVLQKIGLPDSERRHGIVVSGVSEKTWRQLIATSLNARLDDRPCIWVDVFSLSSAVFIHATTELKEKLRQLPAAASVAFYSSASKEIQSIEVPAAGLLYLSLEPDCPFSLSIFSEEEH